MLTLLNSFFRLGISLLNRLTCKDHDMASAFLSSSILILRSLQEMNVEHLGLFSRSVKAQQPWYQIWDLGTKNKRAYSRSSSMYVYHSLSPEKNKARSLLRFLSLFLLHDDVGNAVQNSIVHVYFILLLCYDGGGLAFGLSAFIVVSFGMRTTTTCGGWLSSTISLLLLLGA